MPFALAIIGAALVIVAVRGTHNELGTLLKGDFTGSGGQGASFLIWLAAVIAVGAIGYSPTFRTPSRLLLALIILAMLLSNRGFFAQFQNALKTAPQQAAVQPTQADQPTLPAGIPIEQVGGSASSAGGAPGGAGGVIGAVAKAIPVIGGLFG